MVYSKVLASKQESNAQLPPQSRPHITSGAEGFEHRDVFTPNIVDPL